MSAIGANLQEAVERARILASRMATISPGIKRSAPTKYCDDDDDEAANCCDDTSNRCKTATTARQLSSTKRTRSEDDCSKDSKDSSSSPLCSPILPASNYPRSPMLSSSGTNTHATNHDDKTFKTNNSCTERRILANADDNATSEFIVNNNNSSKTISPSSHISSAFIDNINDGSVGCISPESSRQSAFPVNLNIKSKSNNNDNDNNNSDINDQQLASLPTNKMINTTTTNDCHTSTVVDKGVADNHNIIQQVIKQQPGDDHHTYNNNNNSASSYQALPQISKISSSSPNIMNNHTLFNDSILPQSDLLIPQQYVGLVIGKGGENIRRVQNETGATLYIDSSKMADAEGNKLCTITGSVDSVHRASALVQEIIESAKNGRQTTKRKINDGELEYRMKIPAARTGVIIGRGGDTIRAIRSQTQCTIELDKDATDCGAEEKVFVITGPSEQVQQAQELINARLASCLQSRSNPGANSLISHSQPRQQQTYPPNLSSQSSAAMQYGNNLYSSYWQQQMAAQTAQQDPSAAWAAYYAQYYAAQMQSTYSSLLQDKNNPPDGGGQVIEESNQPDSCDYSSQWAQYYRAHGMIKEAEWIEQQSKSKVPNQQLTKIPSGPRLNSQTKATITIQGVI